MKPIKFIALLCLCSLCLVATAWSYTEVTSIAASPNPFNNIDGETTTITVEATPGVTNLEVVVLSSDQTTVVRSGLTLSETTPGEYVSTWNGGNNDAALVTAGDYVLRVFNPATTTYIGPQSYVNIQGLLPPSPDPFIPTGTNAAVITVQAVPGQTGLSLSFVLPYYLWWWYDTNGNSRLPLTETSTPGVYTASWNPIEGPNDFIMPDGTYTIYVYDSVRNQMATTGQITISGVSSLSSAPTQFSAFGGETTAITANGAEGLNLQARITKYNSSTGSYDLLRTLPLSASVDTYTVMWDGKDEGGNLVPLGNYTIEVWHTGSPARYYPSTSVKVSASVSSVSASPSLFTPTGTNSALITVQAAPGQTGLSLSFLYWYWWYDTNGNSRLPLTETSTPGVYKAFWNPINGPDYNIMPDGTYTIYVYDSAGAQMVTTGQITISGVSSVSATPTQFNALGGETTVITANGAEGLNLQAKISKYNSSTGSYDLLRTLPLSASGGTYTVMWDGKDENGDVVSLGTYTVEVWHTGSPARYYPSTFVQVSAAISGVTASPSLFSPTGTNSALITVQAAPGQTGLSLSFVLPYYWWWYDSNGNNRLPLTETSTPGVYEASWNPILGPNYYVMPDGIYTIYVYDSAGNQMATTGQITIAGVSSVSAAPNQFSAFGGETTAITANGAEGLNLEAKITKYNGSTGSYDLFRTLPLSASGGTYTVMWDGKDENGNSVSLGDYYIEVWHTGSPARYYPSTSVQVSVGTSLVNVSPDPFIPTGINTAVITVQATPGQTGMKIAISGWYDSNWNSQIPLVETSTPGIYSATWDATGYSNWYGWFWGIVHDGSYQIYVIDSLGNLSTATGEVTITGVSSVSADPNPFTPGGSNFATITATGVGGLNLQARVFNNSTNALTKTIPMTEASGTYTAEWDGKDTYGNFAGANTYILRIYNKDSGQRYYPESSIIVNVAVFSISASPDPFVPTGSNSVTITVRADKGQSGLTVAISHPQSGTTPRLALREVGSEGTYVTEWDGKINGVIPQDGVCTILVYDSSGNQFPTTGTLTLSSAKSLTISPNPFGVQGGSIATITAQMGTGLHLEARIGNVRTLPLMESPSGIYTAIWDGKDNSGKYVASGTYNVTIWNTDTYIRYDLQTSIVVTITDFLPPETSIISGPEDQEQVCQNSVTFSYTGSDNLTQVVNLQYAWRIDGGDWSEFTSATSQTLSGLSHGSHTFEVISRDLAGNVDTTPAIRHFTVDINPPVISNIASVPSLTQVTISWISDEGATSQVEYGPSDSYGTITPLYAQLITSHSILITGLNLSTIYHYRVKSRDLCGHEAVSSDYTFTTVQDVTSPDTSFTSGPPNNGKACDSTVNLCWTGSDDVTLPSELQYSFNIDNGNWSAWTTETCYTFGGLIEGLHTVMVKAKDNSGKEDETPAVRNFYVDTTMPTLSNISVVPRDYRATMTWNTSKPTTSQVEYGETLAYGMTSPLNPTMMGAHTVTIDGLTPQATYHFRVKSNDGCSKVVSDDATFTTTEILYPNLRISKIDMRGTCRSLERIDFKWLERNDGPGSAEGNWVDKIFLSTDNVLDPQDTLIGEFNFSDGLDWKTERWRVVTLDMPMMEPGTYYMIVKTDANNAVNESNESDNILVKQIDYLIEKQLTATPDQISITLTSGDTESGEIDLTNLGNTSLTGITATVEGNTPNITVNAVPPSSLNGLTVQKVSYTVSASDESVTQNSPVLRFTTAEGQDATVTFNITVSPPYPNLVSNPGYLDTTMVRGSQTFVEFEVTNTGAVPADNLQVLIPSSDWLSLITPDNINSLALGEKIKVGLALKPSESLPLGPYTGNIVLSASNTSASVNFRFTAISDKIGGLKIIAQDEFTYFANDHPPVVNAKVKISNPYDGTMVAEGTTDASGQFTKDDLLEGYYNLEVSADKHGTYNGYVQIIAGKVKEVKAFLPRQLVTYTWKVVPVQTEDRYIITLEVVFETHVPAPVVTFEPTILDLSKLEYDADGKATVNCTITNHGLIAANSAAINFGDHPAYRITPLNENIGEIPAMSSMTVPVIVQKLTAEPMAMQTIAKGSTMLGSSSTSSLPCGVPGCLKWEYICGDPRMGEYCAEWGTGECPPGIPSPSPPSGPGSPSVSGPPSIQEPIPCPPSCGDGSCNGGETCSSCPQDCGTCPPPSCGDGSCNGGETCSSCPQDCGTCLCEVTDVTAVPEVALVGENVTLTATTNGNGEITWSGDPVVEGQTGKSITVQFINVGKKTITASCGSNSKSVDVVVVKVELKVDWKTEDGEGVMRVNSNYDENNQINGKKVPDFKMNDGIVETDKNLLDGMIRALDANENSIEVKGKIKLSYPNEIILVWIKSDNSEYVKIESSQLSEEIMLPVTLKIEGINGSENKDDVKISAEFFPEESNKGVKTNEVSLTVLKVEFMLSFDDGPMLTYEVTLVNKLKLFNNENGDMLKAAFFEVGCNSLDGEGCEECLTNFSGYPYRRNIADICGLQGSIKEWPETAEFIKNNNHYIGNHTFCHTHYISYRLDNLDFIQTDINLWESMASNINLQGQPKLFRFPYLDRVDSVVNVLRENGYFIIDGALTGDGCGQSKEDTVQNAKSKLREWRNKDNLNNQNPTEPLVLIFHSSQEKTTYNIDYIVSELQNAGFILTDFDINRLNPINKQIMMPYSNTKNVW